MPLNCIWPAKSNMNVEYITPPFSQNTFVRDTVSFPLYRTQIQTFTDLFQDAHQSKLVKDLSSPSPAWPVTTPAWCGECIREIGQVRSALLLWSSTSRKMWVQEWVIRFKARSLRNESWTRATRTLSSWGGVIYDFSQANKEEKWGKKKKKKRRRSFTHELTAPGERTHLETQEKEDPTDAHGSVRFDIHSQTHSTSTVIYLNNNTYACIKLHTHSFVLFKHTLQVTLQCCRSAFSLCAVRWVIRRLERNPVALIFLSLLFFSLLTWQTRISSWLFLTNNELNYPWLGCRGSSAREKWTHQKLTFHGISLHQILHC